MSPVKRIIHLSILCYVFMVFGHSFTYNTLLVILKYDSMFGALVVFSVKMFAIVYVVMITSLYMCEVLFNLQFYLFFLWLSLYINGIMGSVVYYVLNLFIEFPLFINTFLFILFSVGLTVLGIYYESHTFLDKQIIPCLNLKGNIKLAHLTDVHLGAIYGRKFVKKLVNLIKPEKVDFAVITGDLIDGNIRLQPEMLEPFRELNCPVYYVTGNHENYTWKEEAMKIIHQSPLTHIENNKVTFDNRINVIGVDYQSTESAVEILRELSLNNTDNLPNIFLYHVPIFRAVDLIGVNVQLFLCGHLHGGAFLPFSLIAYLLRKKYVVEGLYSHLNKYFVYCCSGVGTSGPCIRTGSKSKIGIITLEGKNSD